MAGWPSLPRSALRRVSEAELRELREIEARVLAGTEPIVDRQVVMLQTMRSLLKASKRKRA
jgi:hypothetical protein